jgi:pimeloyl-ACP methyl ester carboxylesterase
MNDSFLQQLDDPACAVATDFETESDRLLIAFGGIKGFKIIPPFEFLNLTRELPTRKIFLRDFDQVWYQNGLTGVAGDVDGIASFLRETIRAQRIRRVVMIGNSMGGYASILFGALLDVDAVIAFAPQTYIDFWKRLFTLDVRWRAQIRKAQQAGCNPAYLDLRSLLREWPERKGAYHLYYSAFDPFDTLHALNVIGRGVSLHPYAQGGHKLVRHLRDSGALKRILLDALR